MAQRFGRNQRRRAREAIAELQDKLLAAQVENILSTGLLRACQRRRDALQWELDHAKDVAGRMSVLFPAAETIKVDWDSHSRIKARLPVDMPLELSASAYLSAASTSRSSVDVETLILRVHPDHFHGALHVDVQFGDGVWGYGITHDGWHSLTTEQRERLIERQIPRQLSKLIAQYNFR